MRLSSIGTDSQLACVTEEIRILCQSMRLSAFREKCRQEQAYPKNATAQDHATADVQDKMMGGEPSRSGSNKPRAGRMPTKPAARGICRVDVSEKPRMTMEIGSLPFQWQQQLFAARCFPGPLCP